MKQKKGYKSKPKDFGKKIHEAQKKGLNFKDESLPRVRKPKGAV